MGSSSFRIPEPLCGTPCAVRQQWPGVVRKAIDTGSWAAALSDVRLLPLDRVPGMLILEGPGELRRKPHVLLYELMDELGNLTYMGRRQIDASNELRTRLILDGLGYSWFCLGLLGGADVWMIQSRSCRREGHALAFNALRCLMNCWTDFIGLDQRFGSGMATFRIRGGAADFGKRLHGGGFAAPWPTWGKRAFSLCSDLGIDEDLLRPLRMGALHGQIDPATAGQQITQWLDKFERS